jgi:malignant T-cell-amplified sequence
MSSREHISLLTLDNEVLFFQHFDEAYVPSLRLVHKCRIPWSRDLLVDPDAFTTVQVDRGAIKFVLSGANIMYVQDALVMLMCSGVLA